MCFLAHSVHLAVLLARLALSCPTHAVLGLDLPGAAGVARAVGLPPLGELQDKKSTFYQQQRPPAGLANKKKQAGYAVALADCLSDGIWEEEEEPKKAPKKRARIS